MDLARCEDRDIELIRGSRVAIFGYGAQGAAQAANLGDSGIELRIALRPGSPSIAAAEAAGHTVLPPEVAAGWADIVVMLIPDAAQPVLYDRVLAEGLRPGSALVFAHGYAIHYRHVVPRADVDLILVAPLAIGEQVRRAYVAGSGTSCLLAVDRDATGTAWSRARGYAWADGHARASMLISTFADETETDLFAEQTILTGGLQELIDAGFQTLVDAGYPPELAYICCLEEVKLMADLMLERGIAGMRRSISATAEYGGYTRGPRIVGDAARAEMRRVLEEIRSGEFDRELQTVLADGGSALRDLRQRFAARAIESARPATVSAPAAVGPRIAAAAPPAGPRPALGAALGFAALRRIWTDPRGTIQVLVERAPSLWVFRLAFLAGITNLLAQARQYTVGDTYSLQQILFGATMLAPVAAFLTLYVYAALVTSVATAIGGVAPPPSHVRTALAWSGVPTALGLAGWLVVLALVGAPLFEAGDPFSALPPASALVVALVGMFWLVTAIWSLFLTAHALGEVFGLSAWRGLGAAVAAGLALLVIFMLFGLLGGLVIGLATS